MLRSERFFQITVLCELLRNFKAECKITFNIIYKVWYRSKNPVTTTKSAKEVAAVDARDVGLGDWLGIDCVYHVCMRQITGCADFPASTAKCFPMIPLRFCVFLLCIAKLHALLVTNFTVPTASAGLAEIAFGSDGGMWFNEQTAGKDWSIGPLLYIPRVCEYLWLTGPSTVRAGPDGALWFAESGYIGRITTAGSISCLSVPTKTTVPSLGLYDSVYDLVANSCAIVEGAELEYSCHKSHQPPSACCGPEGSSYRNQIAPLRHTSEQTKSLRIQPGPVNICVGPDSNIW